MKRTLIERCANAVAAVPVAFALSVSTAYADEITTALDTDSEVIEQLLESAIAGASAETHLAPIDLPDPEPALIAFAKECATLDAIPLFELKRDRDSRVFVGINFDGVFGIHGQL